MPEPASDGTNDTFFRPLGRRERISSPFEGAADDEAAIAERMRASRLLLARRGLFWCGHVVRFGLRLGWAVVRGRATRAGRAVLLRQMLQQGGTVAQKLGQQLSIRTDVLDRVLCEELRKLLDGAPPIPLDVALRILRATFGDRFETVFRAFDPEPIGSASIACVYQAELAGGERVAIKVRRPGIGPVLDADLRILHAFAGFAEAAALVREGAATSMIRELRSMLVEEIDFRAEARYAELFEKDSRKIEQVGAPKVYSELCTEKVMVTEYCSGAFLTEILSAVENGHAEALRTFEARGFDLREIARSLTYAFLWGVFEADVFHADVHPANIIVQPDNSLMFIDFGSCGQFSNRFRSKLQALIRQIHSGDSDQAARTTLSLSEPIPLINTDRALEELKELYRRYHLALRSKHSPWTEKTSGALFLRVIKALGDLGINARAEMVRYCRANMLYDTMIFRLHPRLDPAKELRRYEKTMYRRRARKITRELQRRRQPRDLVTVAEVLGSFDKMLEMTRRYADVPRFAYFHGMSKASYAVSTMLKTVVRLVVLVALFVGWRAVSVVGALSSGEAFSWGWVREATLWTVRSTPFQLAAALLVVVAIRKIQLKIEAAEVTNEL